MWILEDFCAVIFSGVALHNGLTTTDGMVAIYGNGDFAYSLYRETPQNKISLESMLRRNPGMINVLGEARGLDGTISLNTVSLCVTEKVGIKGLNEYLRKLDFQESKYIQEEQAAINFINEKSVNFKSGVKINQKHDSNEGKSIAAALTRGYVYLSGHLACESSSGSADKKAVSKSSSSKKPPYELQIDSPLNMGILNIIALQEDGMGNTKCLVYINGNLRLLKKRKENWQKQNIWDIHPGFNTDKNHVSLSRSDLDDFLFEQFIRSPAFRDSRINQSVLLGLYQI